MTYKLGHHLSNAVLIEAARHASARRFLSSKCESLLSDAQRRPPASAYVAVFLCQGQALAFCFARPVRAVHCAG